MDWTQVAIQTTTEGLDLVIGLLTELEVEGWEIEDAADFDEFLHDTEIYWDYVDEKLRQERLHCRTLVKIYLPNDAQGFAKMRELSDALRVLKENDRANKWGSLETAQTGIRQEDWEWGWKQYFKPFPVGKSFMIKPSWETCENTDGRKILEIDPASSFGTGSHETTQLCMAAIERTVKKGDSLLDMGTGSGILAIAAALLGAHVRAVVDIDAHCLTCALENAERNGVDIGKTFCGDALHDEVLAQALGEEYDVIAANIVADIIIGMSPMFWKKLKTGGTLICSGILNERADEVENALLTQGFRIQNRASGGDWSAFTAQK